MAYENYSIRQFMNAWFKGDYSELSKEQFEVVKMEYIDTAGMYDEDYLNKASYIHFISNRINSIALSLELQRKFLANFGVPYGSAFSFLWKFGHKLKWNGDSDDFEKQLKRIESKEKKYSTLLENAIAEFEKADSPKKEGEDSNPRPSFVKMLNILNKSGFSIDKNETTVEELAYMILQQKEEADQINSK